MEPMKRYIIWIEREDDRWEADDHETLEEVAACIQRGGTLGRPFVITEHVPFVIAEGNRQDTGNKAEER
jgi:hypothetical protein